MDQAIRVFIVQHTDRPIARAGLCHLLNSHPRLTVVGNMAYQRKPIATLREGLVQAVPDIILLDLLECDETSLELIPTLCNLAKAARLVVLTTQTAISAQKQAVQSGALGLIGQEQEPEILFKALERVHAGEIWLERALVAAVLQEKINAASPPLSPEQLQINTLTENEHAVITLVCKGLKNQAIAGLLFVSEATVRHRLTGIYEKLQVADRLELALFAFRYGLAELPR